MQPFDSLLEESAKIHGHLCPGQVVGVRMAILGCKLIGLDNPKSRDQIKQLLVYVEMDRCTADAVAYVTGVKLGRRSLKFMDYGIMAATFVNLSNEKSFRIISTEESRDLCDVYAPEVDGKSQRQLSAYKRMPDSVLFRVQKVHVPISDLDLPGPTRQKIACSQCGQIIRDGREIVKEGQPICKPCSGNCYFSNAMEICWSEMSWSPTNETKSISLTPLKKECC
ncbi:MAG: formylmethanofuran dehydrogenase [Proteobacteria bacterium]|nr:formylmethanofuran dehydrogenase [Pseudomonadota bacterium]MBU1582334.1 formylmethanofuran dehydrogenase [Pseudomonadota bacterium]MBU2455957.1 formylmethanofuran dehydrogenase [Pseudomonadota bacterium]MBU2631031.1 formylmethanofuran dehydrogenase [Pseudomonadota bacterium]